MKKILNTWSNIKSNQSQKNLTKVDENHTDIVLADCEEWGGETEMMFYIANTIKTSKNSKIVCIVANGGKNSWKEVKFAMERNYSIIIIKNSMFLSDQIVQLKETCSLDDFGSEIYVPLHLYSLVSSYSHFFVCDLNDPSSILQIIYQIISK